MLLTKNFIFMAPAEPDPNSSPTMPGFTAITKGEALENKMDQEEILVDKDQTIKSDVPTSVHKYNATESGLDTLEDLPGDFMRGEVDVKEQMDLAASALDSSLRGLQNQAEEDSPRGELGASFRDTPGGLEEVEAKTDEYLASHGLKKKPLRKNRSH